jgi:hypothetical protein
MEIAKVVETVNLTAMILVAHPIAEAVHFRQEWVGLPSL